MYLALSKALWSHGCVPEVESSFSLVLPGVLVSLLGWHHVSQILGHEAISCASLSLDRAIFASVCFCFPNPETVSVSPYLVKPLIVRKRHTVGTGSSISHSSCSHPSVSLLPQISPSTPGTESVLARFALRRQIQPTAHDWIKAEGGLQLAR